MRTILTLLIFSIFFLFSQSSIGQTFVQNDGNSLSINGTVLKKGTKIEEIHKLLGKPEKIEGEDHYYTKKGIMLYADGDEVSSISVFLYSNGWAGSPKGSFEQDIEIGGLKINSAETAKKLENLEAIEFTYDEYDAVNGWEYSSEWGNYEMTTKVRVAEYMQVVTFYFFSFM